MYTRQLQASANESLVDVADELRLGQNNQNCRLSLAVIDSRHLLTRSAFHYVRSTHLIGRA